MIEFVDVEGALGTAGLLLALSSILFSPFFAFYILTNLSYSPHAQRIISRGLLAGVPIGYTGIVAGFLTGLSRSPAVDALVPAILTFVGLTIVYIMGKGRARPIIVGFAVLLFSSNLLLGTLLGSAARTRYEEYLTSAVVQDSKVDQEFLVRRHCKGLGLISDVSKPCTLGSDQEKPKSGEKP